MREEIFEPGSQETVKGVVHLALFGLSAAAQLYNAAAFLDRRESHSAFNVAVYSGLAVFEAYQVVKHLSQ